VQLQLNAGLANGQRPDGTSQKTGLRTRRHHQHHDPGTPDQPERHETPDPGRFSVVNPRFQHVWLAGWRLTGRPTSGRLAGDWLHPALARP
jgi:hypothetical protein